MDVFRNINTNLLNKINYFTVENIKVVTSFLNQAIEPQITKNTKIL